MMCRTAVLLIGSVLAAGLSIAAQSPADVNVDITVTGCLQKGFEGGLVVANSDVPAADDKPTRVDPTGAGDVMPSKVVKTWWLQGGNNLEEHVGRRIEVTGREQVARTSVSNATPGAVGTSGTKDTPPTDEKEGHNARRLQVKSVKVLTGTCP